MVWVDELSLAAAQAPLSPSERAARERRQAALRVSKLRHHLDVLGIERPVAIRMRAVVRATDHTLLNRPEQRARTVVGFFMLAFCSMAGALAAVGGQRETGWGFFGMGVAALVASYVLSRSSVRQLHRYGLAISVVRAIESCADAYLALIAEREDALRCTALCLADVERDLTQAHRHSRALPRFSHRRRALRLHARTVAALLHQAEARIDTESRDALPTIAELLLTIGERYCEGRLGAFVDPDRLEGIHPVRDARLWRQIALTLMVAAATIGAGFLGVAGEALPYVAVATAVCAGPVLYPGSAQRALELVAPTRAP
ncbi:hypothetical protein AB0I84_15710 [Streptomyces spectabilis]|uniref:hypothetical protein n=1 Tax=Streptomyces spectabilis TaxID=68270 RepID=UPI0033C8944C